MSDSTQPFLVQLNFAADKASSGAFEFPFVTRVPSGESLYLRPQKVPLYDLRKKDRRPSLDVEGFTWQTVPYEDLNGPEGWEQRYGEATCEWLRSFVGAKACKLIGYQIRRRATSTSTSTSIDINDDKEAEKVLGQQPVSAVHVDMTWERASAQRQTTFGSEFSEAPRFAIFNIWRPLKGPVMDAPLAVCDWRTLDPWDMDNTTDRYGGGYFIKYNDKMKWMYIRDQMPDEILVFQQYDSTQEPAPEDIKCIPHTAFIDEERKDQGPLRESIELRCAVVY